MAKAKNKSKAKGQDVPSAEDRIKSFEAAVVAAVQTYQIGIRPYMDKYGPKIEYVDLTTVTNETKAN